MLTLQVKFRMMTNFTKLSWILCVGGTLVPLSQVIQTRPVLAKGRDRQHLPLDSSLLGIASRMPELKECSANLQEKGLEHVLVLQYCYTEVRYITLSVSTVVLHKQRSYCIENTTQGPEECNMLENVQKCHKVAWMIIHFNFNPKKWRFSPINTWALKA